MGTRRTFESFASRAEHQAYCDGLRDAQGPSGIDATLKAVDEATKVIDSVKAADDGEIEKLKACLLVLDATIYMLEPFMAKEQREFFAGQIAEAKRCYEAATGEESMIGFIRNRKGHDDGYRPMLVPVGLGADGKMNIADWPWCPECKAYHHPDSRYCRKAKP